MATTITANGINFPDGSAGSPSIGGTDTNTGLFTGSDIVGFATGGSERLRIDASGNINIANDSGKLQLGTSADLKLYHDGSHSYLDNTGTGNLYLKDAGAVKVRTASFGVDNADGSEAMIAATADGAVELYHDNSKKFHTYSGGCSVFGNLNLEDNDKLRLGDSSDLQIYHDGTDSQIVNATNDLILQSTGDDVVIKAEDDLLFYVQGGAEAAIIARNNGEVDLRYDGNKKFETTSSGIEVDGSIDISGAGTLVSIGSTTQPLTFKNNSRTGTYNQSCMYAHQNNNANSTSNGIVFEVGRLTDSSSAEVGSFVVATRGGQISALIDPNGIQFNGDKAAANGLNDYEEGTWTPTDGSGASISITNNNTASYTKIGRLVHIKFDVTYASNSSSADATLSGIPYSQGVNYGSGVVGWTNKDNANGIHVHVGANDIYLMDNSGANSSGGKHLRNDEISTLRMIGNATYFTA